MNHDAYPDSYIRRILLEHQTFAVVGASPKQTRPSYFVMKYLLSKGYRVIPVNPGQAGREILGQTVVGSLQDVGATVDVVDIFRGSAAAYAITQDAIRVGAKAVWMQIGVRNDEAAALAEDAGLQVVMNRCPKIEYGRLSGEIGWAGVNSRTLSNKRPLLSKSGIQQRTLGGNR